jgi:diguanylate cyclase
LIEPEDFLPYAEEYGLTANVDEWVLRRACLDGKNWPQTRLSVNIASSHFGQPDFVARVKNILRETGFNPCDLELELTENAVVNEADKAEAAILELRGLGVRVVLDDFGTGYSSLIYLRRFAFDKIKVDRSFLGHTDASGEAAILLHSIVHLARALGITVTAEGVETKEQHRFLQALGCHELQGYLFAHPMSAERVTELKKQSGLKKV